MGMSVDKQIGERDFLRDWLVQFGKRLVAPFSASPAQTSDDRAGRAEPVAESANDPARFTQQLGSLQDSLHQANQPVRIASDLQL
jgi:hypothetical protein